MSNKNDITGDRLINKRLSKEGEDNWDKIFKKKKELPKYELDDGQLTEKQYAKIKELAEYELDKSTGEVVKVDSKKLTDAFNGH